MVEAYIIGFSTGVALMIIIIIAHAHYYEQE